MSKRKEKKQAKKQEKLDRKQAKDRRNQPVEKQAPKKVDMRSNPLYPDRIENNAVGVLLAVVSVIVAIILLVLIVRNFSYALNGYPDYSANSDTITQDYANDETADDPADDITEDMYDEYLTEDETDDTDIPEEEPDEPEEPDVSEEEIHTYEIIQRDVTWQEAFDDCLSRGGYLVRINTAQEWDTVISQIQASGTDAYYFYISGARNPEDSLYYWKNEQNELYGEPLNSESFWGNYLWLEGEPSFQDGDTMENVMAILYMKSSDRWVLNDVADSVLSNEEYLSGKIAYICEYE